jgi:hypothetical protein
VLPLTLDGVLKTLKWFVLAEPLQAYTSVVLGVCN